MFTVVKESLSIVMVSLVSLAFSSATRMEVISASSTIARETYLFWHGLWILCGRPETGQVAMRFTHNNYHYKIRKIKNETRYRAK